MANRLLLLFKINKYFKDFKGFVCALTVHYIISSCDDDDAKVCSRESCSNGAGLLSGYRRSAMVNLLV